MIWLIKGDSPFLIFLSLALRMFSWLFWSSAFLSVSCFSCSSILSISCWFEAASSGRKHNTFVWLSRGKICKRFEIATLFSYCKYLSRNSCVTCLSEFSPIPQLLKYALDLFPFCQLLSLEWKMFQLCYYLLQITVWRSHGGGWVWYLVSRSVYKHRVKAVKLQRKKTGF